HLASLFPSPPNARPFPYPTLFRSRTVIAAIAIARRRALGTPTAPRFATPAGAINTAVQGGFGMPPDKRGIGPVGPDTALVGRHADRKSTRLNSSHEWSSYAVFCLK